MHRDSVAASVGRPYLHHEASTAATPFNITPGPSALRPLGPYRPMPDLWSTLYVDRVPDEQTARECDFIQSYMPLDEFPTVLDLACGAGRHSIELARRGYITTGVDINRHALDVATAEATRQVLDAWFVEGD